jgi:outer membrane protein OmpA-like peptidoglycan-associated protein
LFFTLSGDGAHGYFSSVKPDGLGEKDIYMIVMPPRDDREELLEKMRAMNLIVRSSKKSDADSNTYELQISIKDEETGEMLEAELLLSSKEFTNRPPSDKSPNAYLYNVNSNKEQKYTLIVKKKGFAFATVNFVLTKYEGKMQEVKIPIKMSKAKPGALVQLHNIYYDVNQYVLKETSYASMNNLLDFLKEHPAVKIEVRSHTDSKGSADYNLALSQKRAQSVVNFLKANGIASKRIKAKGYGEKLPLVSNDDEEEGRELNRRTEFKIIK